MAIKIIPSKDVYVTEAGLARYRYEYDNFMRYYAGPPIPFEDFVRSRQKSDPIWA